MTHSKPSIGGNIRILIADDHEIVREGIARCMASEPDFEIVGLADNGRQSIELYDLLQPDVLLLDIQMPEMNGLEVLIELNKRRPQPKVIVVTAFGGDEFFRRAIHVGAQGYLLKDSPLQQIWETIRRVAAGQCIDAGALHSSSNNTLRKPPLTNRELEVLGLMAEGCSNKQIGVRLLITEGTAKTHVFSIMEKLDVSGRTEAVVMAARRGILDISNQ